MAPPAALWDSSSSSSSSKTVCVMDAGGRLGSALLHRLLHAGYTVHAALHNPEELMQCYKSEKKQLRLRVFQADPLDYHSIMDALKGCSALFYSFELPSDHPTYDELMSELEVRAAHNVLEACAQTESIDKVIFTSSATAIIWRDSQPDALSSQSHVDERNWSDVNFCKKFKLWHGASKTVAEKTAWALAMDRGVNMVSINGGLLMCPDLSIKDPYLLGAAEMYRDGVFVTVDLKFLVDAHICVFQDPSSYGRYLCFNRTINSTKDVLKLATRLLPSSSSPHSHSHSHPQMSSSSSMEGDNRVYQQRISNDKLSKLMIHFQSGVQVEWEAESPPPPPQVLLNH